MTLLGQGVIAATTANRRKETDKADARVLRLKRGSQTSALHPRIQGGDWIDTRVLCRPADRQMLTAST